MFVDLVALRSRQIPGKAGKVNRTSQSSVGLQKAHDDSHGGLVVVIVSVTRLISEVVESVAVLAQLSVLRRQKQTRRHGRRRRRVVDDVAGVAHDRRLLLLSHGRRNGKVADEVDVAANDADATDVVVADGNFERTLAGSVERGQGTVVAVGALQQGRQRAGVAGVVAAGRSRQSVQESDLFVRDLLPDLAGFGMAGDDSLKF